MSGVHRNAGPETSGAQCVRNAKIERLDDRQTGCSRPFLGQLFFYIPAATPYLLARGLDLAQINCLQAISLFTQVVLEVPTGVVADRIGRRRPVFLAAGARALPETIFFLARDYPVFAETSLSALFALMGTLILAGSLLLRIEERHVEDVAEI